MCRGDGGAARRLLFGNRIQTAGGALLQALGEKPVMAGFSRLRVMFRPPRGSARAAPGIKDRQQQILRRQRLHRRQQGVHIALNHRVNANLQ